jgi:hypothetical protein
MRSCDECKSFCNVGQGVVLIDNMNKKKTFCKDCYKKLPKEQKKQYTYVEGRIDSDHVWGGFMMGGMLGAAAAAQENKRPWQQDNKDNQELRSYSEKDMNEFSIDFFDRHLGLLDKGRYQAVKDYFEGKTDSRSYRKFIEKASR